MDIPENYKDIEINGRKFRLNKMDAKTGSFMLFKLMKILTPMVKNIKTDEKEVDLANLNLTEIAESLFDLEEKEFRYIQDNALQVVQELLGAGPTKVLNQFGEFEANNIEFDTGLVMNLTVQSLYFNIKGFFKGSPLESMLKGLNISQLNLKM
ncbi:MULTISPECIES: phage tail assembly chaperone [unclassified Clostridium]|uniref:phage tail assembly chaperone n=1 Tax=unclassified Clostridium TaxID=2614128 RepID=UPI0002984E3C|nr:MULTISPECIES: hypothetical protein [unclassified Clostridium]EKQ56267.1 MAG: hypothetical protein A370_02023 [Clostridium sp. Maddingley MBC34-26]